MKYIITVLLFMAGFTVFAQQPNVNRQVFLEYKKQFIAESLYLTDDDKKNFMPIYEQYLKDKEAQQKEMQLLKRGFMAKSDDQLKSDIAKMMDLKAAEVALEKNYMDKFLKVITVRQLAALYAAENNFKKEILKKFGGRQGFNNGRNNRGRGGGMRRNGGGGGF